MAAIAASERARARRDRAAPDVPQPLVPHAVVRGRRDDRARARSRASVAAPLITRYDPNAQDLLHAYAHPSGAHWLGTDELGRDVLTRLIYAGRVDLLIAFFAVLCPFCLGTALGCLAGYYGALRRHRRHAPRRHRGGLPVPRARARARVRARARAALDHHRHHGRRLGLVRAHRARRDPRAEAPRVRARGARGRPLGRPHHRPPPAAERDHAGDRVLDERHRAARCSRSSRSATSARASRRPPPTGAR